jgi:quercetin dioxygenase-like cupin family protein
MSFDPNGYVLRPSDGAHLWFLDGRMVVKAGGEQTGGALTVIEFTFPEGAGPPRHIHDREDEAYYILDGVIAIDCGDRHWTASIGDFVFLPHGIPHCFTVAEGPVHGVQITNPSGFEHFLAETGRPAEAPGLPAPSEPDVRHLTEAAARNHIRIIGPPM